MIKVSSVNNKLARHKYLQIKQVRLDVREPFN